MRIAFRHFCTHLMHFWSCNVINSLRKTAITPSSTSTVYSSLSLSVCVCQGTSAGQSGVPARAGLRWSPDPHSRRAVDLSRPEWGASACQAAVVPDPRGRRAVDLGRPQQGARTCSSPAALSHFHTTFDSAHNAILR